MGGTSTRLSWVYVVFPAGALIVVWPVVRDLPPLGWPPNLNWVQVAAAAPWWLGLAAAPGYLYAWSWHYSANSLPPFDCLLSLFDATIPPAAIVAIQQMKTSTTQNDDCKCPCHKGVIVVHPTPCCNKRPSSMIGPKKLPRDTKSEPR